MIDLRYGDCLELMKEIPDNSVDMVLTDPPYGTTACKWDSVIPFEPMWKQLKRITRDNGAICLFGAEPFSSNLRMSNIKMFKYDWIWKKSHPTGFLNAWRQPLRSVEIVSVFYQKQVNYSPQITDKPKKDIRKETGNLRRQAEHYGRHRIGDLSTKTMPENKKMPRTILSFPCVNPADKSKSHPTQKPVALLEYLIKTYTLEGETVLDFTMGSGSTGVACKNLGRKFIGIEKEEKYFEIAKKRINGEL